uniref:Uncharacterized protein n=1 Tax=Timema poppense TaxID=170557 RepID=A0A7R9CQJ2_TIMPO|nr:unnamed protein product [Timema poppensis]
MNFRSATSNGGATRGQSWSCMHLESRQLLNLQHIARIRSVKTTLSTPDRVSNLDLPVVSSLVYWEFSALDHAAPKLYLTRRPQVRGIKEKKDVLSAKFSEELWRIGKQKDLDELPKFVISIGFVTNNKNQVAEVARDKFCPQTGLLFGVLYVTGAGGEVFSKLTKLPTAGGSFSAAIATTSLLLLDSCSKRGCVDRDSGRTKLVSQSAELARSLSTLLVEGEEGISGAERGTK